ncbi:MAG TPA: Hsp20/alpha crystallin family protein [Gaiellaceae bacterium]|nr:Hsp20/alpha crystallin family protein [Gaiellaceae bacterium]
MTPIVKRPPLELDGMERWLNSMLSGIGFGPLIRPFLPAADVYVSEGVYVVELEVPGFTESELGVELSGRMLTISGKHEETREATKAFRLHERLADEFERTFVLPPEVDVEKVASTFVNGVLRVTAPLPAAAKARKVPITTA